MTDIGNCHQYNSSTAPVSSKDLPITGFEAARVFADVLINGLIGTVFTAVVGLGVAGWVL